MGLIKLVLGLVLVVPVLFGWGRMLSRLVWPTRQEQLPLYESVILGVAGLSTVAMVIHFFLALTPIIAVVLIGSGLAFAALESKTHPFKEVDLRWLGFFAVALVVGAVTAIPFYDAGLYHFQVIRWANEQPILIGAVNLHGRFGFNSTWFPLIASLRVPGLEYSLGLSMGLALAILFLTDGVQTVSKAVQKQTFDLSSLFTFILVCFVMTFGRRILFDYVGTTGTDMPAALLALSCCVWALRLADHKIAPKPTIELIWIAALTSVLIKFSHVPLLLLPLILTFVYWQKEKQAARWDWAALALLLVVPSSVWLVRGWLMSGCLVYPAALSCTAVSWAEPLEKAQQMVGWIRGYARRPDELALTTLDNWAWVGSWALRSWTLHVVKGLTICFGLGMLLVLVRRSFHKLNGIAWFVFLTAFLGGAFWFVQAPDIRFGYGLLLPLGLLPLVIGLRGLDRVLARSAYPVLGLCCGVFFLRATWLVPLPIREGIAHWPNLPNVHVEERTNWQGVVISKPVDSVQCWLVPPPCTSEDVSHLTFDQKGHWPMIWSTPQKRTNED